MSEFSLLIGDKNISSWSLRPWLLMTQGDVGFEEIQVKLDQPDTTENILKHNPSGRVPALTHQGRVIWDSLAICEYIADIFPEKNLWPENKLTRAHARAICAEMHAGFQDLRNDMPMACHNKLNPPHMTAGLLSDITRILDIWRDCRDEYLDHGPFLFGHFTIADCMYAPVVFRFKCFQVQMDDICQQYCKMMLGLPALQQWLAGADATQIPVDWNG